MSENHPLFILSNMHMWNFEGIEQISMKLLALKVTWVICTGLYLKRKEGKRWNRRCLFSQKVVLRWKVCSKNRMRNKLLRIIKNVRYFNTWLRIWKCHKLGIKDCYPKRGHVSYITESMLLMWISRLWNKDKTMWHLIRSVRVSSYSKILK